MNWYSPKPRQKPKRLPRRKPIKVVPSGIGDKGLVGNWLFYYLKGGDHLHDFSPYGNHGTINGAKWIDGRYGWALDFNASESDYVEIPSSAGDDLNPSRVTVSMWVYIDSSGQNAGLLTKGQNSKTSYSYRIFVWNTFRFQILDEEGDGAVVEDSEIIGSWTHLVLSYNGSELKGYVNGDSVGTASPATPSNLRDETEDVYIGRYHSSDYTVDGKIEEVRIYDRALSAQEIQAIYNRTKGIFR